MGWAAAAGESMGETRVSNGFPTLAGVLFGLGLGGFFDGIVLHQLLQWHHMLSNWYPIVDVPSLELNTVWDGIFHSSTYVFVVIGLLILWRTAHRRHLLWSNKLFVGTLLLGWGLFNTVEGIVDHEILGIHHINERYTGGVRIVFDLGFIVWGLTMLAIGWLLLRQGKHQARATA